MKKSIKPFSFLILCTVFSFFRTVVWASVPDSGQDIEASSSFEDGGSFGFDSEDGSGGKGFSVIAGGKLSTGFTLFLDEFKDFQSLRPSSLVWGNLFLEAKAPLSEVFVKLKLNDSTLPVELKKKPQISPTVLIPAWIDEAYIQSIIGGFVFGGGIKKITWGRADALSVLDVVNPLNLTDGSEMRTEELKIAQPMFYFSAYMPAETKLEAVFLPMFEPNRIALTGRWRPYSLERLKTITGTGEGAVEKEAGLLAADSAKLRYAHGGARFTATAAGFHDIGIQYFYGYFFAPAVNLRAAETSYTPYHNLGIDYATAAGGFNIRAELAVNVTGDLRGNQEDVYNPQLAWNAGFDYTMSYNLSLNMLISETVRLYQKAITSSFDIEAGESPTETILMISLSQTFLRGGGEWKIAGFIGLEDADFLIIPGVHFQLGTILLDFNMGFIGGKNRKGRFAQYSGNHFVKAAMGYEF